MSYIDKLINRGLFTLTYILILFQAYTVNYIEDNTDSYLSYIQYIYYFFCIMTTISHLTTSLTEPGKINHDNNLNYIDFYQQTRSISLNRAELFNKNSQIKPPELDLNDSEDDSDIEGDDHIYKPSKLDKNDIYLIKEKFGICLTNCVKCNVFRVYGARHCSSCHGY